jgi:hypothetical protein
VNELRRDHPGGAPGWASGGLSRDPGCVGPADLGADDAGRILLAKLGLARAPDPFRPGWRRSEGSPCAPPPVLPGAIQSPGRPGPGRAIRALVVTVPIPVEVAMDWSSRGGSTPGRLRRNPECGQPAGGTNSRWPPASTSLTFFPSSDASPENENRGVNGRAHLLERLTTPTGWT